MKAFYLSSTVLTSMLLAGAAQAQTATQTQTPSPSQAPTLTAPQTEPAPQPSPPSTAPTPGSDVATGASSAAKEDAPSALGDIIVTAQRRSENLQHTAMAVSALGGDLLTKQNITIPAQLTTLIPAFRANNVVGPYANFTIRGIGTFATTPFGETAVVTNVEGVPIAFITSAHGLLYDLQRVEVLKGPQGTLYGRNATAGVVNLIANKPGNEFAGNFGVSIGNYNSRVFSGAVDVPLSDTLTTRTAVIASRHDGYYKDGTDDEDNYSGRFTLQYKPDSDVTASIVGDYSHDGGKGNGSTLIKSETATNSTGGGFVGDPRSGTYLQDPAIQSRFVADGDPVRNPANNFQNNTFWGVTGTLDWKTPIGTVTAIVGHRESNIFYFADIPSFYYGDNGHFQQTSGELRLAGDPSKRFKWLLGTFYLFGKARDIELNEQSTSLSTSDIHNTTDTFAGFGQATYSLTDRLRLTGGLRYSIDHKTSLSPRYTQTNFPFATTVFTTFPNSAVGTPVLTLDARHTWSALTYKAGIEFDASPDSLLYANIDRGYKSGVFFYASPTVNTADPEYVTSYTVGSKNRFFDHKLQVNLEGFLLNYTNQQLNYRSFVPGVGNTTVTANIGQSKIYGGEADIKYLATPTTTLNLLIQYEHARYTKFTYVAPTNVSLTQACPVTVVATGFQVDCSGRPSLYTPTWIVQGGVQQRLPLATGADITFKVNGRYESGRSLQISYLPEAYQGGYTKTDMSATYTAASGKWSVGAFVDNLENSNIKTVVFIGRNYTKAAGGLLTTLLQAPRTFGGRFDVKF